MLNVGDKVVIMSAPGTFEVVEVNGDEVTIQNASGLRKVVLAQAVRRVERPAAPQSES
jgi:hypothetical protein